MEIFAFHSSNPADPDLYHDHDDCPDGSGIASWNRVAGAFGYHRCPTCRSLDVAVAAAAER